MNYVVEKDWLQGKYHCLIVFQAHGHRCGYVGVNKDELIVNDEELEKLEVHGGVTYLKDGHKEHEKEDYRYVGFDCGHYFDKPDVECMKEYFPNNDYAQRMAQDFLKLSSNGSIVKTQEFVEDEIMKLVEQLDDWGKSK